VLGEVRKSGIREARIDAAEDEADDRELEAASRDITHCYSKTNQPMSYFL
jgi:hypothetical protein